MTATTTAHIAGFGWITRKREGSSGAPSETGDLQGKWRMGGV